MKKKSSWESALAAILSLFLVLGFAISLTPQKRIITTEITANFTGFCLVAIISFVGWLFVIRKLFSRIDAYVNRHISKEESREWRAKDWLKISGIILACWMPYMIICYPAISRGYDYFWQLLQGMGVFPLSNHHPILGSIVYGALFRIGYFFGGAHAGLFFSVMVQSVLLVLTAGFAASYFRSISDVPNCIYYTVIATICFCPVFPGHTTLLTKDAVFTSIGILLFTQILIKVRERGTKFRIISSYPSIVLTSCLLSLYRNGVSIIAVCIFAVLIFDECRNNKCNVDGNKAIGGVVALLSFIVCMAIWGECTTRLGVFPTDSREALALPTKQIIRTVQMHPESLTNDDDTVLKEAYHERLSKGETIESIVGKYDDMNSDYIKIDYAREQDFEKKYLMLWASLGIKHPGTYFDALARSTDGYWYPMKHPHIEAKGIVIHTVCTTRPEEDFANEDMRKRRIGTLFLPTVKSLEAAAVDTNQTFEDFFEEYPWLEELMNIKSPFTEAREKLGAVSARMEDIPFIQMVLAPGTYLWLLLLIFGYLLSRKKSGRYMLPILLIEAMACLSPVNGYTRYVLLVELYSLIMIILCFEKNEKKEGKR